MSPMPMGLQHRCPLCSHPMWGTHSSQQGFALLAAVQPQKELFRPQKHHTRPAGTERVSGGGTSPGYQHRAAAPRGPRWGARGAAPSPGVTNGQGTSCTGTRNEPRCAALPSPAPLPCKSSAGLVHRTIPAAHCPGTASTEAQALHQAAPGPQEKFKAKSA